MQELTAWNLVGKMIEIYPYASLIAHSAASSPGDFIEKPQGITIHYTADDDINRVCDSLEKKNLGYHLIICKNGSVIQKCYLNKRANHAGAAKWRGLSPNKTHIAIALLNWGLVEERMSGGDCYYSTWSSARVEKEDVVFRQNSFWEKATDEQEQALDKMLKWFVAIGIDPQNICGHDECATPPGRKIDPGGILSKDMPTIRKELTSWGLA